MRVELPAIRVPDATASLRSLVEQSAALEYAQIDEDTVASAAAVIADVLAAADLGMREPELSNLAGASPHPAKGTAGALLVTGQGRRFTPERAAFLHGCAAVAHELDESLPGGGHPGAHVVPAALAVAQSRHRSGSELLAAVVAGYEVSGQLFRAFRPVYPAHPHGLFGSLGAAVAVAMLDRADPVECVAIVAAAPVLPGWVPSLAGANARNVQVGGAAGQAVTASELAAAGFHGEISAVAELLPKIAGPEPSHSLGLRLAADPWLINSSVIRRHAVAGPLNAAVDAALRLGPVDYDDIVRVTVTVPQRLLKFSHPPLKARDLAARFSLPYVVLASLVTGSANTHVFGYVDWIAATTERVEVVGGDSVEELRLEVMRADGLSAVVVEPLQAASSTSPLPEQVLSKWDNLADEPALGVVRRVLELPDVNDCVRLFAGMLR
jgi:2-methylcitrate dehydratase PrpD